METIIIKLIKSLNRIMASYKHLVLRRLLINLFTIMLFSQTLITTVYWMFGRDISNSWLGILTIEHTSWAIMVSYYFKERKDKNNKE